MKLRPLSVMNSKIAKGLIFLNNHINTIHPLMRRLWKNSLPIAFVDGFANNVFRLKDREVFLPHLLSGDFDSVEEEVLTYYRSKESVQVIHTPNQDATDFTKCLKLVSDHIRDKKVNCDAIVGAYISGGRSDHEFGIIKTLYEAQQITDVPLILLTECCAMFLLPSGMHTLYMDTGWEMENVGLIPIGKPCTVTTTGLEWNLDQTMLSFETIVSTSNHLKSPVVNVQCDSPLLFTVQFDLPKLVSGES